MRISFASSLVTSLILVGGTACKRTDTASLASIGAGTQSQGTSCPWNAKGYAAANPALAQMNPEQLRHHFIQYGIREKRSWQCAQGSSCPWTHAGYLAANPDLEKLGGLKAGFHFGEYGLGEGRVWRCVAGEPPAASDGTTGLCPWNAAGYLSANPQLANLSASELPQHYANFGQKEGRTWHCKGLSDSMNPPPQPAAQPALPAQAQQSQSQPVPQVPQNQVQPAPQTQQVSQPAQGNGQTVALPVTPQQWALMQQMQDAVNKARAAEGLNALSISPNLTLAAQKHSEDLVKRGYFSHVSPEGTVPMQRAIAAGYRPSKLGENLGQGMPASTIVQLWLGSPGHRYAMMHPGNQEMGIGVAGAGMQTYWTVMFGAQ